MKIEHCTRDELIKLVQHYRNETVMLNKLHRQLRRHFQAQLMKLELKNGILGHELKQLREPRVGNSGF